jgi:uncharacterized protein (TIGR01655 family)
MTRVVVLVFIGVLIVAGGAVWVAENYSRETYYVFIREDGEIEKEKGMTQSLLGVYRYRMMGVQADGREKKLDFTANHNLRHGAYLKVLENRNRGVISWEEVQREDVPEEALYQLEAKPIQVLLSNE